MSKIADIEAEIVSLKEALKKANEALKKANDDGDRDMILTLQNYLTALQNDLTELRREKNILLSQAVSAPGLEGERLWGLLNSARETRPNAASVGQLKEYLVIKWESRVMKMISYDGSKKFWHFTNSIQSAFEIPRSIKLYKMSPHASVEERILISNKEQLESILEEIDSADDEESTQVLYVFTPTLNNSSPQNTPIKQSLEEEEKSSESTGKLSEGKKKERDRAKQSKFREDLLYRDGERCRLCSLAPVEAAHIIDVEAKLTKDELRRLCHWNYDHFVIGINEDGYLVTKQKGKWKTSSTASIFRTPEEKGLHSSPLKEALRWKYDKFISKRDNKTVIEQMSEKFERLWSPKKDYKFAHEESEQEETSVAITSETRGTLGQKRLFS